MAFRRGKTKKDSLPLNSTLYLKFIVVYIILGFLALFVSATLASGLTYSSLKSSEADRLYAQATAMANDYLPGYFSEAVSGAEVTMQLRGLSSYMGTAVWLVDQEGTMLFSARRDGYPAAPGQVPGFNPAESGSATYQEGDYHGCFAEDVITVSAPVVQGFSTKGYLLIHKSVSDLTDFRDMLMRSVYATVILIYLLSFLVLLAFQFLVYRPLRRITEAATQYASGNLDYEIPVTTQDEMGYLSASLNYMSAQLRDMEDYQKKFVANVSHDFRSPLTSIKGYVEAMADGTIPPEMQQKYLNIILFETERLTDLTQDLLTLNEFDRRDLMLDKEVFDIHEVIKNTAASFEGICTKRRIFIELLLAARHLNVYADRKKIQQVLYNLIDNAVKFSDADSSITIETTDRGDKVYISVRDYGIGIPREALNKIWERFYKTDTSRGKDKRGTGLGLSIVKEAIQAHGENINVISTEGVGSEFIFSLPKRGN